MSNYYNRYHKRIRLMFQRNNVTAVFLKNYFYLFKNILNYYQNTSLMSSQWHLLPGGAKGGLQYFSFSVPYFDLNSGGLQCKEPRL